jgi:hypothetical protein
MRSVPTGICRLFHERRTASKCSDRDWLGEIVMKAPFVLYAKPQDVIRVQG